LQRMVTSLRLRPTLRMVRLLCSSLVFVSQASRKLKNGEHYLSHYAKHRWPRSKESFLRKLLAATCLLLCTSLANAAGGIVSLGGSVTEIIYALGQEEQLIATDMSSLYPPEARELPQVGYYRAISVEGLVSTVPELIL